MKKHAFTINQFGFFDTHSPSFERGDKPTQTFAVLSKQVIEAGGISIACGKPSKHAIFEAIKILNSFLE